MRIKIMPIKKIIMFSTSCSVLLQRACYILLLLPFGFISAQTSDGLPSTSDNGANNSNYQVAFQARSDNDFLLIADYVFLPEKANAKQMPGVIVLHDCHHERSDYQRLTMSIAEQGLHTLALDFRGYGQSIAEGYSAFEVKKNASDIGSYQSEMALLTSYWPQDLVAAYHYLRRKVNKGLGISVVAGGCAANYAVALAEKVHLSSLVLITPEMSYGDKERYKNLIDIPSYFIGSTHHMASIGTAKELFEWNGAARSKMQVFKGDKANYQLIKANKYLVNDVAQWLTLTLR
jgi:dienelactone hydrolase